MSVSLNDTDSRLRPHLSVPSTSVLPQCPHLKWKLGLLLQTSKRVENPWQTASSETPGSLAMARSSPSRVEPVPDSFRRGLPRKQKIKGVAAFSPGAVRRLTEPHRAQSSQSGKGPGNVTNPSEDLGLQGSLVSCPFRKVVTISPCLRPNNT